MKYINAALVEDNGIKESGIYEEAAASSVQGVERCN